MFFLVKLPTISLYTEFFYALPLYLWFIWKQRDPTLNLTRKETRSAMENRAWLPFLAPKGESKAGEAPPTTQFSMC